MNAVLLLFPDKGQTEIIQECRLLLPAPKSHSGLTQHKTGIKSAHLASCHQREIYKNRAMRQSCQIYLLNKETCNATVFITIQCCINDEIVSPLQHIPKFLNGVKV